MVNLNSSTLKALKLKQEEMSKVSHKVILSSDVIVYMYVCIYIFLFLCICMTNSSLCTTYNKLIIDTVIISSITLMRINKAIFKCKFQYRCN
jgi:hypothetical protein